MTFYVIYDCAGSSIAMAVTEDFDWNSIFDGVEWFHFTRITPALGDNIVAICKEACKVAKNKRIVISCVNYRNKLWSKQKAKEVMSELCQLLMYV